MNNISAMLLLLNSYFMSLMCDNADPTSNSLVQEKKKEVESVLAELFDVSEKAKAAENEAGRRRELIEEALTAYEKLRASELLHFNSCSEDSLQKTNSVSNLLLAEVDKSNDCDKRVFELKSKTSYLRKKLLQAERDLADAEINFIALHNQNSHYKCSRRKRSRLVHNIS